MAKWKYFTTIAGTLSFGLIFFTFFFNGCGEPVTWGNNPPAVPSNPNPADGATDVSVNADLSWNCTDPDGDTLTYDIYFGTSSPPPIEKEGHSTKIYDPGLMDENADYYWKIVAKDGNGGETSGPVWHFKTGEDTNNPPNPPSDPYPADGATDVSINVTLSWTCSDPDGDPLTYDIYFGTASDPPLVKSGHTTTSYDPGTLQYETKYYWKIVADDGQSGAGYLGSTLPETDRSKLKEKIREGRRVVSGATLNVNYEHRAYEYVSKYNGSFNINGPGPGPAMAKTPGPVWSFTTKSEGGDENDPPNAPTNPDPYDGETGVDVNHDLSWDCSDPDDDPLTYDIYFGTSTNPPLVKTGQTSTTYDPGTMDDATEYYWYIVAKDDHGHETAGPTWSFATNKPPNEPSNPDPTNGETDVDIDADLSWTCSDPDDDPLTYDIYFGTSSNPPLIETGHTTTTYDPGPMDYDTMYYWKIRAWDDRGHQTTGPIWHFTTYNGPYLWNADWDGKIYKLNPAEGSVISWFYSPGDYPMGLTWDGTYLWNTDEDTDKIYKINPSTGSVVSSFDTPGDYPTGLTWDGTYLWHADRYLNKIYKINPNTGSVVSSFTSPGDGPTGLAWDGTYLWNADRYSDTIYKLNPADGSVVDWFYSPGAWPTGLAWDGVYLWNADRDSDKIYKLNASDGAVVGSFDPPGPCTNGLEWQP
jgi:hypothetical protein